MRVTQGMLNSRMLSDLNRNTQRMDKYMEQLTTNRTINRPSDDPIGITYSLQHRSELNYNEQYTRSTNAGISWTEQTDSAMGQANDILLRIKELTVQGANGTYDQTQLTAIAAEIDQNYEGLVQVANTQLAGKYIFSGQKIEQQPFQLDGSGNVTYTGDTDPIQYQTGPGIVINVNLTGEEAFGQIGSGNSAFEIIKELSDALKAGNQSTVTSSLGKIDSFISSFQETRAIIGAKQNRLELSSERLTQENVNIQSLLSKTEDVDIPAVITNLKTAESVYQATLSAGAKIIRPSLADFLR